MCARIDGEGYSDASGFVDVGSLDHLPPGGTMRARLGAADFTLANVDGRVVAVGDLCLCCGRSLSTASFAGGLLTCSGCGWKYDVQRGCVDGLPHLRMEMHDVRVEDGRLLLSAAIATPAALP